MTGIRGLVHAISSKVAIPPFVAARASPPLAGWSGLFHVPLEFGAGYLSAFCVAEGRRVEGPKPRCTDGLGWCGGFRGIAWVIVCVSVVALACGSRSRLGVVPRARSGLFSRMRAPLASRVGWIVAVSAGALRRGRGAPGSCRARLACENVQLPAVTEGDREVPERSRGADQLQVSVRQPLPPLVVPEQE